MWDHEILYADRSSSKGKILLVTPVLRKTKLRIWEATKSLNTYFILWTELMNCGSWTNEVFYIQRSWTYLQVSFESLFSLMQHLNMTVVQHFEVMLAQTLNYFV
jgi:hypothetical protein